MTSTAYSCRYFLQKDQLLYSCWFYYMWSNVIAPELKAVHVTFTVTVKNAADADELHDCKVHA